MAQPLKSTMLAVSDNATLTQEEENLVDKLVGEFSERSHLGESLSLEEFLDRCPNKECKEEFRTLANMSQLADANASVNYRM